MKNSFVKSGFMADASGSGGGITDIVNGYAILKEQNVGVSNGMTFSRVICNKDRSKVISYTSVSAGGTGANTLICQQLNPANIAAAATAVSSVTLNFGQLYSATTFLNNIATISPDDDFVLLPGVGSNTNIYRVAINPATYQLGAVVSFDTGDLNNKKIEIIDADNYVNYLGQQIHIFNYDGSAMTLTKKIDVGFDIVRINTVNGFVIAIGLNDIKIIDPSAESVIYSENIPATLSDVFAVGNYAVIKTLSITSLPVIVYKVTADGAVEKLALTIDGAFPAGAVKSLINGIKDDNVTDERILIIYHSDNAANIILSINIADLKIKAIDVGADALTGTPGTVKPQFLSGNRIIYSSSVSGLPSTAYTSVYVFEFTEISHRRNGRLYKIVGLG